MNREFQYSASIFILLALIWASSTVEVNAQPYEYYPGDANMGVADWPTKQQPQLDDCLYLRNYIMGMTQPCLFDGFWAAADINGSCTVTAIDITMMVSYFRGIVSVNYCPTYPPTDPIEINYPACTPSLMSKESPEANDIVLTDPGNPDTIIVGNLNGDPIIVEPGGTVLIAVWAKNDEGVGALHIPLAIEDQYLTGSSAENFFAPLSVWDVSEFLDSIYNQPSPDFNTYSLLGISNVTTTSKPKLNTSGLFVKIADITFDISPDELNIGDTTYIIEGFYDRLENSSFADTMGFNEWTPVFVNAMIIIEGNGFIRGTVTDHNLAPILNVHVLVEGEGISDTTNPIGAYFLSDVPEGTYNVSFSHPFFWDTTAINIDVVGGDTTDLDMIMWPIPRVISRSPVRNELDVPLTANVSATFNIDMDSLTINGASFRVMSRLIGGVQGMLTYDNDTRTVYFDPDNNFAVGDIINVCLTTDIESSHGIPLAHGFSWWFTAEVPRSIGEFNDYLFYGASDGAYAIFGAEFEGDNDIDIVTANTDADNITVFFNNGDGTMTLDSTYDVGVNPKSVFASDFDNDGDMDIAVSNAGSNNVIILFNDGSGTFSETRASYDTEGSSWSVFGVNLNGDALIDLAAINNDFNSVSVLINQGEGAFAEHVDYPVGDSPSDICAGDFNGDGFTDLATVNPGSNDISVLINNGDGTFPVPAGSYDTEGGNWSIWAADYNGDGAVDIAVSSVDSNNVSILLNDGDGAFPTVMGSYDTEGCSWSVFGADIDGDNDIDLASAVADSSRISILFNDGSGVFSSPAVSYATGGNAWDVFIADLDSDGSLDLIIPNTNPSGVSILINELLPILPYVPGDVNMYTGIWPPIATGPDVTYLVNYFRGVPTSHSCLIEGFWCSADANGDCNVIGSDVTKLVNVFRGLIAISYCADYEPAWPSPSDLPTEAPVGWPGCE